MNLNELLERGGYKPKQVLVFRHRPYEPALNEALPTLVATRPHLFDAYQRCQGPKVERTMQGLVGTGAVASFIRYGAARALFVGLFSIRRSKTISVADFWRKKANRELRDEWGMRGVTKESGRKTVLWFDLETTTCCDEWKGRLVIGWPGGERAWYRRAHRGDFPVEALLEHSGLKERADWQDVSVGWANLRDFLNHNAITLCEWRGIYYIVDRASRRGYVGAAYGAQNLLGRWREYAASGHGGNKRLKGINPRRFQFSILQLVAPSMEQEDVSRLEQTWIRRLQTRTPYGLNDWPHSSN